MRDRELKTEFGLGGADLADFAAQPRCQVDLSVRDVCPVVVDRECDLEERMSADRPVGIDRCDDVVEGHVAMVERIEVVVSHPREQVANGFGAVEPSAQGERVDEHSHHTAEVGVRAICEFSDVPIRHRRADHHVIAYAESVQEGGECGVEQSERGGRIVSRTIDHGVAQPVVERNRYRTGNRRRTLVCVGMGLRGAGRLWCAVGRGACEQAGPVGEIVLFLTSTVGRGDDCGVVAIVESRSLPEGVTAVESFGVGRGEVVDQNRQRGAVGRGVVDDEDEDVLADGARRDPRQEMRAHPWLCRDVDRGGAQVLDQCRRVAVVAVAERLQMPDRAVGPDENTSDLRTACFGGVDGTQAGVPRHEIDQCVAERLTVKGSRQAQCEGHQVVGRRRLRASQRQ
ncbi:Uncharacterised protein [Mycobacteroides abscessus subsp. abscessus]|nr:Uncharacterised protein [Mycobacteroides abscessus subsp. abscessus]